MSAKRTEAQKKAEDPDLFTIKEFTTFEDVEYTFSEFIAVLKDGKKVKTKVIKDKNGLHRFVEFSNTIGWFPLNYR